MINIKKILRICSCSIFLLVYGGFASAIKPRFYQIDLIIFTQPQATSSLRSDLFLPFNSHAKILTPRSNQEKTYQLLAAPHSLLKKEYWALKHQPGYKLLAQYSWLQPLASKETIQFPSTVNEDWQIDGHLRIQHSNYYLLDGELLFTKPSSQQAFKFTQHQRLKAETVYYFDHAQAGLLIKIHEKA